MTPQPRRKMVGGVLHEGIENDSSLGARVGGGSGLGRALDVGRDFHCCLEAVAVKVAMRWPSRGRGFILSLHPSPPTQSSSHTLGGRLCYQATRLVIGVVR